MAGKKGCSGTTTGVSGPWRTPDMREIHATEIVRLLRRGYTKGAIAERIGISPSQLTQDWKKCLKDLRQERAENTWAEVIIKLEEYGEIKREAWESWDKSKRPIRRHSEEYVTNTEGEGTTKITDTKTYQIGDKGFLDIVLRCLQAERELLALDPPKSMKLQAQVINWDVLCGGLPPGPVPDDIEAEIQRAMGMHGIALDELEAKHGISDPVQAPDGGN